MRAGRSAAASLDAERIVLILSTVGYNERPCDGQRLKEWMEFAIFRGAMSKSPVQISE
jgi:hypothetical protein